MASLSPEVVSLVHHIELHESSWWNEAVSRIALACLLESRGSLNAEEVNRAMRRDFGVRCSPQEIDHALRLLDASGRVIGTGGGSFAASQDARSDCARGAEEFRALEVKVGRLFEATLGAGCTLGDESPDWAEFRDRCLFPLLAKEGAQAAAFSLGCTDGDGTMGDVVATFVADYDKDGAAGLATCIQIFLAGDDLDVREYVLRQLDAQFIVSAAALDASTIQALTEKKAKKLRLNLVLDTNFLFSLLGWHDHPSNQLAEAVREFAQATADNVQVRLAVLPITIAETRRAIELKAEKLERIRWTTSLAEAALKFGTPGLAARYLESQKKTGFKVSITEYAEILAHDLESMLNALGVDVIEADMSEYSMRQDVVDSINDQIDFERAHRAESDRREYDLIRHDMMAYHWVVDQRPSDMKTGLDAGIWLITLDFRLLGFDRYMCRVHKTAQACLHPSTAVQMLQFWVPSTEALREAMYSSIRQPLFPAAGLAETERVTYKIIERLGQLDGIDDVSADAIRDTLADATLRKRMRANTTQAEELELIEQAFVRLASEKEKEAEEERVRADALEEALRASEERVRKQGEVEEGRKKQVERLKAQAAAAASRAEKLDDIVQEQGAQIEDVLSQLRGVETDAKRGKWLFRRVVLPGVILAVVACALGVVLYLALPSPQRWVSVGLLVLLAVLGFLGFVARSRNSLPAGVDSKFADWAASMGRVIWGAVLTVALGFIASMLWDMVSSWL